MLPETGCQGVRGAAFGDGALRLESDCGGGGEGEGRVRLKLFTQTGD